MNGIQSKNQRIGSYKINKTFFLALITKFMFMIVELTG